MDASNRFRRGRTTPAAIATTTKVGTATLVQSSSHTPSVFARYTPDSKATRKEGTPTGAAELQRVAHSRACSYVTARLRRVTATHSIASATKRPIVAAM